MASRQHHKFQPPKGTRDFYPEEMAVRRHLEAAWRDVSVVHGFDEIEGPMFEHLELYTVKSGDEIVSELFSFRRAGGDADYALRPEFTPTLARMFAARAAQLPQPTRWFCIPNHFRAERPQRGRLREFIQWNVDVIGDGTPAADAEIIAVGVGVMERLGLSPDVIRVKISHRDLVTTLLRDAGLDDDMHVKALALLDKRAKMPSEKFREQWAALGADPGVLDRYEAVADRPVRRLDELEGVDTTILEPLVEHLDAMGIAEWCEFDLNVVRGLAYYTGTVFEFHEATGKERAVAGGGRYDGLVELFGGPPTPAVGFAMGDVVIRLVLEDHGCLSDGEAYMPRPDVFVVATGDEDAESSIQPLLADFRRRGLHARTTSRATRNVGKLLKEASRLRARYAVILGEELARGVASVKNLDNGEQSEVDLASLVEQLESTLKEDRQ